MNRECMERMSASELDEYAKSCGIEVSHARDKKDKLRIISERRERVASVRALGIDFEIPVKRVHDKRLTDLLGKHDMTDEDMTEAMVMMLGREQFDELVAACTDDDGTVDVNAMGVAYVRIVTSSELKNF